MNASRVVPTDSPAPLRAKPARGARLRPLVLAGFVSFMPAATALAAPLYQAGQVVSNFSLVDRATGKPVALTDFAGKIVLLDWFAWWCPFCQAAAPQLLSGVDEWYAARKGNPAGIQVIHVGVNLQPGQEPQTQNFVNHAHFPQVLQDFDRAVANRFATDGQPIFAIINGVTNSPNHKPWELLYSQLGHGQTVFPVAAFRAAIDSVQAPAAQPPEPPVVTTPSLNPDLSLQVVVHGTAGASYRIDASTDLTHWTAIRSYTAGSAAESVTLPADPAAKHRFFRLVAP